MKKLISKVKELNCGHIFSLVMKKHRKTDHMFYTVDT